MLALNEIVELWHVLTMLGLIMIFMDIILWTFFMFPIGIGLLLTAVANLWIKDYVTLIYTSSGLIVLSYIPCFFLSKRASGSQNPTTSMDNYIGKTVTVTTRITPTKPGTVSVFGENWTAQSAHNDVSFEPDESVTILKVVGNRLLVTPVTQSAEPTH